MLGDLVHRGAHFVDGRGGLVGFTLLTAHALVHVVHARGEPAGALVETRGSLGDGADHALIAALHGVECAGHLADFVTAVQRNPCLQVATALHVQHDVLERVEVAEQKADEQLRSAEQTEHQHRDRHGVAEKVLAQYLNSAGRAGQHSQLLTIRRGDQVGADHGIAGEQSVVGEGGPAAFGDSLTLDRGALICLERDQVRTLRQRSIGRPNRQQRRTRLRCSDGVGATGALLQLYGVKHQQQRDDEGHHVQCPELVLERQIANPNGHDCSSSIGGCARVAERLLALRLNI